MRVVTTALAAAALAAGLSGCPDGGPSIPETDVCRTPADTASITGISARHVGASAPLSDRDALPFTIGGQGTTMIGLELLLEGPDVPSCAQQRTTVIRSSDGMVLAGSSSPIATYDTSDGGHVSGEMWIFPSFDAAPGTLATLRVESYGTSSEVEVFLDHPPTR